jgi:hypothetical protein
VVESSKSAFGFKQIATLNGVNTKFVNTTYDDEITYYRLKVTSVINQTVYSNTISLKNTSPATDAFTVSTLVDNQIRVNASENYLYKLVNVNGQVIATGNGIKGNNTVDVSIQAKGMYILQIFAKDKNYSKKIIKS